MQIEPPFIEQRFSKTHTRPFVWYNKKRQIDSPYSQGARNMRYSSPNNVSNAVFYDQASNLSIENNEMYQTTVQRDYSSPHKKDDQKICKTFDLRNKSGYNSPSKHLIGHKDHKQFTIVNWSPNKQMSKSIKYSTMKPPRNPQKTYSTTDLQGKPPISTSPMKRKSSHKKNSKSYSWRSEIDSQRSGVESWIKSQLNESGSEAKTVHNYWSYKSNHLSSSSKKKIKVHHTKTNRHKVVKKKSKSKMKNIKEKKYQRNQSLKNRIEGVIIRFEYPSLNNK